MLRSCCFNWRVWAGAGVIALGVLALAPGAAGAVVPVALGLACPLSMILMMRGMGGMGSSRSRGAATGVHDIKRARIAALEAELAELRSPGSPPGGVSDALTNRTARGAEPTPLG